MKTFLFSERLFDGNQAGPGPDDRQQRDRCGVNFRINDPPLLLDATPAGFSCHAGRRDGHFWLLRQDLANRIRDLSRLPLRPANHLENPFVAWSQ